MTAAGRPTHPVKELEKFLQSLESQGWRVSRGRKYYQARCNCGAHQMGIHLTPSDPNYLRNRKGAFRRTGCWKED